MNFSPPLSQKAFASRKKEEKYYQSSTPSRPGYHSVPEVNQEGRRVHAPSLYFKRLSSCRQRDTHSPELTPLPSERGRTLPIWVQGDTEENVLLGIPKSAVCVRKFDDSLSSAIRKTYRSSLRSSSMREPRYPLLRVVQRFNFSFRLSFRRRLPPKPCSALSSFQSKAPPPEK